MEYKKEILKPILLVVFVAVSYIKILNGFFLQDEWFSYSWYILHRDLSLIESFKFFFAPSIGHYNPFTNLLQHNLFSLMGMNYAGFALIGILLHLSVVLALYYFLRVLFSKNSTIAFLTALIFGLFASIYQGVAWVVADMSTLLATFFGIISSTFYLLFLKNKNLKHLLWSLIILIISLMFKEITIGLFVLYFIFAIWNKDNKLTPKSLGLIFVFGILYFLLRLAMIYLPNTTGDSLATSSQSVGNIVYNLFTLPAKSIAQIIIPPTLIKYLILSSYKVFNVIPNDLVVDIIISFSSIAIGILIIALCLLFQRKVKDQIYKLAIFFGLGWIIFNSLIFSISPESAGTLVVVDSRNLYFSSIGVAIVIVALVSSLFKYNFKKVVLVSLGIAILNSYILANNLNKIIDMGKERKYILNQITSAYRRLPPKTIIFITSNRSYYGLPDDEKIPPFQSGLGQTLLVWYYQVEKFPNAFYENRFLWDIKSQGYREFGNRGFGYFRDYQKLKEEVIKNKLSFESVIAFEWDYYTNTLTDTTEKIRSKLKNENY